MAWHQRGSDTAPRRPHSAHDTQCALVRTPEGAPQVVAAASASAWGAWSPPCCCPVMSCRQCASAHRSDHKHPCPSLPLRTLTDLLILLGRVGLACCLPCFIYPMCRHTPNTHFALNIHTLCPLQPSTHTHTHTHTPFALWNFLPFMCFLTASTDLSISCPVSAQYSISLGRRTAHSTQHTAQQPSSAHCVSAAGCGEGSSHRLQEHQSA